VAGDGAGDAAGEVAFWAFLLTAKQDTVKTSNRILDTLWEALSG